MGTTDSKLGERTSRSRDNLLGKGRLRSAEASRIQEACVRPPFWSIQQASASARVGLRFRRQNSSQIPVRATPHRFRAALLCTERQWIACWQKISWSVSAYMRVDFAWRWKRHYSLLLSYSIPVRASHLGRIGASLRAGVGAQRPPVYRRLASDPPCPDEETSRSTGG